MLQSVDDIRRESERSRAEFSQTVGTLRGKLTETADHITHMVSPAGLKAEVSGYLAGKGRNWVDALKQHATDNPMQTVAAGLAIAVPALKLVRTIPLPLLMIGAGAALTSPRVRKALGVVAPSVDANSVNLAAMAQTVEDRF